MNRMRTLSRLLLAGTLALSLPALAGTTPAASGDVEAAMPAPFMLSQQWPPEGMPMEPGGMQQGMPPGYGQQPMHPSYGGGGGQTVNDPMGHYHLTLPQGAVPVGSTLNFMVPSAGAQVSVSSFAQARMVQMYQQNFPTMMRNMGATIDTQQQINHHGQQGTLIGATMRNQQGGSVHAMTVFLPHKGVMVQVMGPEQNAPQMGQLMTQILNGLQ